MFHKSLFQCIKSSGNDDQSIVESHFNYQKAVETSARGNSAKFIEKLAKMKQKIDNSLSLNSHVISLMQGKRKKKKLIKRCSVISSSQKAFVLSSTLNDNGKAQQQGPLFNGTIISSISCKAPARDFYSDDDDSDLSSDDSDMSLNDESFFHAHPQYINVSEFVRSRHEDEDEEDVNSSLSSVSDDDYDYECSATYESYLFNTIERQRRSVQGKSRRFNPLISSSRFNILDKTAQSQIDNRSQQSSSERSRSIKRFQSSRRNNSNAVEFVPNNTSSRKSLLVADKDCYNTLIGYDCHECNSQLEAAVAAAAASRRSDRQLYSDGDMTTFRDFEEVNVCSSTLISSGNSALKAPVSHCLSSFLSSSSSSAASSSSSTLSSANSSSVLSSTTILQSRKPAAYRSTAASNASTLSSLF